MSKFVEEELKEESGALNVDKIEKVNIDTTMRNYYLDYSMSVIASRALPDVRDGLKPVQRRILWAMNELGAFYNTPHRKVARIVGDTMGKYHPHGDSSIEDALVNMAQDWKSQVPLIDGHGNFGSIDGDDAAASRYIEARLSKISNEMLADINKNTVDFVPNFDGTEQEPSVLPGRFPNLLVNGTTGIAVGMATNIPPHNLGEIMDGVVMMIDNEIKGVDTSVDDLMTVVKGPDFPTGALILGKTGINDAYHTGHGSVKMRGVCEIEPGKNGRDRIVITEIPYGVNKKSLVESIAQLAKEGKVDGISDVNDYSSREGMMIVVDLKKGANSNVILNQLYKHTNLQTTFGVNMLCLVPNHGALEPKCLNLHDMLFYYLNHQKEVVTRRTQYDKKKAEDRIHILEGLLIALTQIDEVIKTIRASSSVQDAKANLSAKFALTEVQASAIVEMRLRALTSLETEKIEDEKDDLVKKVAEYTAILNDKKVLLRTVKKELEDILKKYSYDRKTQLTIDESDFEIEDLIPNEEVVVLRTALGYMKRLPADTFTSQRRGGKGIKSLTTIANDYVKDVFTMKTHDRLLFFTNYGRLYVLRGYEIPQASRTARGTALVNLIQMQDGETVSAIIPVTELKKDLSLFIATKHGIVKRTSVSNFLSCRKTGTNAIKLRDDDKVINVHVSPTDVNLMMVTRNGLANQFNTGAMRELGKISSGVRCMRLKKGDEVVSMQMVVDEEEYLLVIAENGYGKMTSVNEFKLTNRGSVGVKCYNIDKKTGKIIGATVVHKNDELLIVTADGNMIRLHCNNISETGRIARGARLVRMPDGVVASDMSKVYFGDSDEEEAETDE